MASRQAVVAVVTREWRRGLASSLSFSAAGAAFQKLSGMIRLGLV
jgi:hypothetical protein